MKAFLNQSSVSASSVTLFFSFLLQHHNLWAVFHDTENSHLASLCDILGFSSSFYFGGGKCSRRTLIMHSKFGYSWVYIIVDKYEN